MGVRFGCVLVCVLESCFCVLRLCVSERQLRLALLVLRDHRRVRLTQNLEVGRNVLDLNYDILEIALAAFQGDEVLLHDSTVRGLLFHFDLNGRHVEATRAACRDGRRYSSSIATQGLVRLAL